MNRISNVLMCAAIAATGFSAAARSAVATKPRVESRPGVEVQVRPTARTAPSDALVQKSAVGIEQFRQEAANDNTKAPECSSVLDASAMASGTIVSYATFKAAADKKILARGKCETDPTTMNVEARTNLGQYAEGMLLGKSQVQAMKDAFKDDGVELNDNEAADKINAIAEKCAYVAPVARK